MAGDGTSRRFGRSDDHVRRRAALAAGVERVLQLTALTASRVASELGRATSPGRDRAVSPSPSCRSRRTSASPAGAIRPRAAACSAMAKLSAASTRALPAPATCAASASMSCTRVGSRLTFLT